MMHACGMSPENSLLACVVCLAHCVDCADVRVGLPSPRDGGFQRLRFILVCAIAPAAMLRHSFVALACVTLVSGAPILDILADPCTGTGEPTGGAPMCFKGGMEILGGSERHFVLHVSNTAVDHRVFGSEPCVHSSHAPHQLGRRRCSSTSKSLTRRRARA